jgi:hypothetical protein
MLVLIAVLEIVCFFRGTYALPEDITVLARKAEAQALAVPPRSAPRSDVRSGPGNAPGAQKTWASPGIHSEEGEDVFRVAEEIIKQMYGTPTPSKGTARPEGKISPAPESTASPAPITTTLPAPGSTPSPAAGSTASPVPATTASPAPGSSASPEAEDVFLKAREQLEKAGKGFQ